MTKSRPTERSLLSDAASGAYSAAEGLLNVLNAPQQLMNKSFIGEDRYEDLKRRSNGYVTGRDMLREMGVARKEDTWGNAIGGLAYDVLADPLNLIGIGAFTKAGKLAKMAGVSSLGGSKLGSVLTNAARAGAEINPAITKEVGENLARRGQALNTLTDAGAMARPAIGRRVAGRLGTIGDLEKAAEAGVKVPELAQIQKQLSQLTDAERMRRIKEPLRRDFSVGPVGFNVPGGLGMQRNLDRVSDAARFGPAGRAVRAFTDKNLDNIDPNLRFDRDTQELVAGTRMLQDEAAKEATQKAGYQAAKLYGDDAASQIFSREGNKALSTVIERPQIVDNALAGSRAVQENPAVRQYADWWSNEAAGELAESKKLGLVSEELEDANIEGYLPRTMSPLIEAYTKQGAQGGKALSTMTGDMFSRSEATKIPGGRNVLSFKLAEDSRLVGPKRLAKNDEEAADIVGQVVYGDAKAERKKTKELAALLHRLPPESMSQQPLFGQHPTEQITKYMAGRAAARAGAKSQLEILASRASPAQFSEPSVSAASALDALSLKSDGGYGASDYLRKMIGTREGISPDSIKLTEYFVPERLMGSLTTGVDSVTPGTLSGIQSWWQANWRNSILNWPSRYVRDLMGGMYSNHMEGALTVRGMSLATNIMKDGAHAHADEIAKMPYYAGVEANEAASRFYADLMSTELLSGGSRLDRGVAGEAIGSAMPGVDATGQGPVRQMLGSAAESYMNIGSMFNPEGKFAQAGAKTGDISDTFNRLTGYTELMFQGNAPEEASRLMKRTHVDYGSLSAAEKHLRKNFVPFYTFMSRMIGEQARRIVQEPAKMNRTLEVLTAPDRYDDDRRIKPDYIANKFGHSIPGVSDPTGRTKTYMYNYDFPGLEQIPLLMDLAQGNISGALGEVGGMLNPMLKMAAENITGTQIGFGRNLPLDQKRGNLARILNMKDPDYYVQGADRLLELTPGLTRPLNVVRGLSENRADTTLLSRLAETAVNNTTGIKVKTLTKGDELREAANSTLQRVKGMGAPVRTMTMPYINKETLPTLPREQQIEYKKYQDLNRVYSQRRKREKSSTNLNER